MVEDVNSLIGICDSEIIWRGRLRYMPRTGEFLELEEGCYKVTAVTYFAMYSDVRDFNLLKEKYKGIEMWLDDQRGASTTRHVGLMLEKQNKRIWDGAFNGWSSYCDKVKK